MNSMRKEEAVEQILSLFSRTENNEEFIAKVGKIRYNPGHSRR